MYSRLQLSPSTPAQGLPGPPGEKGETGDVGQMVRSFSPPIFIIDVCVFSKELV